jgi:hypothetical protein
LVSNLQEHLLDALFAEPGAKERMNDLLSDDPTTAALREQLKGRRKRLLHIKQKLDEFTLGSDIE